jgi:hypothetical protein
LVKTRLAHRPARWQSGHPSYFGMIVMSFEPR